MPPTQDPSSTAPGYIWYKLGWSVNILIRYLQRYFSTTQVPVLVVANKSDQGVVRQDYILQPEAFCAKHKLPPPQKSSARAPVTKDIFIKLATMAAFP